ncbi:MMPL family transporter [Parasulfuritortus cantonensis]|uniref:MMPL family transporter n=1 Tax=Parasulfuritortus cantonensis TaxID=2528202 RepID=A0A4R1BDV5_9PROT|nr:MMPL family transporter [Parasulfuritortus cantonensis]TCJ15271.1 MMPL family transporter [Parasulfuritortus cantonensis]
MRLSLLLPLANLATRHARTLVALAGLWLLACALFCFDIERRLTLDPGWDAPDSGSALAAAHMRDELGRNETPVVVLFSPRPGGPGEVDAADYRQAVDDALTPLYGNPDIGSLHTYYTTGNPALRSRDGTMTYAIVNLKRGHDEGVAAYQHLRASLASDRLDIRLGGELAVYVDVREQLDHDLKLAETISFVLLAGLLVWVFRSGVAAVLPLIVGAVTIVTSVACLKLATWVTDINVYAPNVVSMLGLGLAVDYSLFMVSRFREELALDQATDLALRTTMLTAGRTLVFSGVTVAASLFCLFLLPQRFFHNMGLAGGISVASAMLTTIVLLPALLAILGRRVNRLVPPFLARRPPDTGETGNWYRFSHFVMRHARSVLLVSLAILLVMGLPVKDMKVGPADSRSLPLTAESRQVQQNLENHFPTSEVAPIVVVVHSRDVLTAPASLSALYQLSDAIAGLPGVTRVAGLMSLDPGFSLADYQMLYQHPDQFPQAAAALDEFSRDRTTLMYVHFKQDPTSPEARALVAAIRALARPPALAKVHVGGFPAFHLDYLDTLGHHVPIVLAAIVGVIFVLLFLMLGSLLVPLKVVLTNLLSLSATFGALVWIIQEGHLSGLLGFTPQGALDGTILVLIFASAFGLSIDYEVFLLSRVKEMCDLTKGDSLKSVSTGMQRSGPIITNAALLIGVVLGAFAMGQVVFIKAIGLGLLLSVLVDATLVRMLLVPATLRLMGWLNWWAPKPLMRVYQRLNLGEIETDFRSKQE